MGYIFVDKSHHSTYIFNTFSSSTRLSAGNNASTQSSDSQAREMRDGYHIDPDQVLEGV